jgi:FkbM family methyltransferase
MKIKNIYKHYKLFLFGKGISFWQKYKLHKRSRYKPFLLNFFGKEITVPDAGSFLGIYQELFIDNNYWFKTNSKNPLIIDCGSNIGLSVIYFKNQYPDCKIEAYEADPEICKTLENNIKAFNFNGVNIHPKAVWENEGHIEFMKEGGASGMISNDNNGGENIVKIPTVRLRTILEKYDFIDFLKIDIEGAEYNVLKDCSNVIGRVQNLFVEYHSIINKEQNLGEILNILKKAGFRYHLTEAFTSSHPFIERNLMLDMDLLLNIYAYK